MFAMTRAIVNEHSIVISEDPEQRYSKYGPLQSVLAVPHYAAAKPFMPLLSKFVPEEIIDEWVLGMFNILVTALSIIVMAAAAAELGVGLRGAVATALLWGFTTMAWPYSKMDFSEPLLTVCMLLTLLYSYRSVRLGNSGYAVLAGVFFGLSVLTKYGNILLAPVFFIAILGRPEGRVKRAAAFFITVTAFVAMVLAYNYARFGDFFKTGYALHLEYQPDGSFIECVYGILFSSGKSIFLYSPPLILALVGLGDFLKKSRMFAICIGLSLAIYLILYTRFSLWGGGLAWGPRYFLPFVGMGMWMAAPFVSNTLGKAAAKWRLGLILVLALAGLAIQGLAVSVRMNTAYENGAVDECVHLWMSGISDGKDGKDLPEICRNPIDREWEILRMRAPRMFRLSLSALKGELGDVERQKQYEHTYLDYWGAYLLPRLPRWAAWALVVFTFGMTLFSLLLLFWLVRGLKHIPCDDN